MSFVYWELIASKYQARILPQVFWALKFSITDRRGKKAGMSEKAEVPTPGYHPGPVPVLFTFHHDQCPDFFNKWLSGSSGLLYQVPPFSRTPTNEFSRCYASVGFRPYDTKSG